MFCRRVTRQFSKLISGVLKTQGVKHLTFSNIFGEFSITDFARQRKV